MKGVVFTEFLDFAEACAGADTVDDMIDGANLPSGGAYTSVGKYEFSELASMIGVLSDLVKTPAPVLIRAFGEHLFGQFAKKYPQFFQECDCALDFIEGIEDRIHVEVLKLYPDAELPKIDAERTGEHDMTLRYESCRPLGELCLGLIQGCALYFGDELDVAHDVRPNGLAIVIRRKVAAAA